MVMRKNEMSPDRNGQRRPDPDPTTLTTQQATDKVAAAREIIETRLEGMDKAIQLLQTVTDKFSAFVKCEVKGLQELHEQKFNTFSEKFDGVKTQFSERDTRTTDAALSIEKAINAALMAAKELVAAQNTANLAAADKSEKAFTKQIDAQGELINTKTSALDVRINEVKAGLDKFEARAKGIGDGYGWLVGFIGMLVGVIPVVILLMK